MKKITHAQIIEELGGTMKVAEDCGLEPSAISHWKTRGIPRPWLMVLRLWSPEVFKNRKVVEQ